MKCNISIFLFCLLLKDFLKCLLKGAGTENNSGIIISKDRVAPALTTPGGLFVFNLFTASLPFFLLFPVARLGFSDAVIYSSVGQQSQQPAGAFVDVGLCVKRRISVDRSGVMSFDVEINRLWFARYGERKDRHRNDVLSTEKIRSGAVTAPHQGFSSLQNGRLQMLSSPPGAVFYNRLPG